jgi:hypothetical protein
MKYELDEDNEQIFDSSDASWDVGETASKRYICFGPEQTVVNLEHMPIVVK